MNSILRYWGKAKPDSSEGPVWHPLAYHCLDVAATGFSLLAGDDRLARLALRYGMSSQRLSGWIVFLLAIHDLGKFGDGFQGQRADLMQSLQGRTVATSYTVRHDTLGYLLLESELPASLGRLAGGEPQRNGRMLGHLLTLLRPWVCAVTGHHGRPPKNDLDGDQTAMLLKRQFPGDVLGDALDFLSQVQTLLLPDGLPFNLDDPGALLGPFKRDSWLTAGLAVAADWIGSNQHWFPYWDSRASVSLPEYWHEHALDKARVALGECGLLPCRSTAFGGLKRLFPTIDTPTPLQRLAETLTLAEGPQVILIEEVTGGGKTEAALTLAHRLMASGAADGIYVALPTMATADAMHARIEKMFRRLYEKDAQPSLILAHSAAQWLKLGLEVANCRDAGYGRNDHASASQDCTAWLSDSRKKALLAHVGVGTIDQALLGILAVKHQSLRLWGLASKVLVVDEVHACDAYVGALLKVLLRFHAAFGGAAILLSATLPQAQRQGLLAAFAQGARLPSPSIVENAYPLLTHLCINGVDEHPVQARTDVARTVAVDHLQSEEEVLERIGGVIETGQCVCWVRNTVADALRTYEQCHAAFGADRVMLFHARYALCDRLRIGEEVLHSFGESSGAKERSGRLLIATQVVEQSLDVDFDYLITDLAPIDLVIQRAGRLRRHSRDLQGNRVGGQDQRGAPMLGVVMPPATNDADAGWYRAMFPKAALVYPHHGQLWLTGRWLQDEQRFSMPSQARDMIESVYGVEAFEQIPAALQAVEIRADGEDRAARNMGAFNGLDLDSGYEVTSMHWNDDESAPTRLGEATTTVRLARIAGDCLLPWASGTGHDWELSQVTVRQSLIKEEDEGWRALIETAKAGMPDEGKYCVVLPLIDNNGVWQGTAKDASGRRMIAHYNHCTGLTLKQGEPDESDR